MTLGVVPQRHLDLGTSQWFRPDPTAPATNQIIVRKGVMVTPGLKIVDRFTGGDQLTGAFTVVAIGNERWDLVYLDQTGAVQILLGTAQVTGGAQFTGAPSFTGGPPLPDGGVPVAIVHITEQAGVVVTSADIFQVTEFIQLERALEGHLIDFGATGGAPAGSSTVVTALFAGETAGGGTVRGVVTTPPFNAVEILNQNFAPIMHTASNARVFGRLTFGAGVWTLTYVYIDSGGTEQTVGNMATDTTVAATNIRLKKVTKVFSKNESTRPILDQITTASIAGSSSGGGGGGTGQAFGGDGSDGTLVVNAPTSLGGHKNYVNFTNNSTVTIATGDGLWIDCTGFFDNSGGSIIGTGAANNGGQGSADATVGNMASGTDGAAGGGDGFHGGSSVRYGLGGAGLGVRTPVTGTTNGGQHGGNSPTWRGSLTYGGYYPLPGGGGGGGDAGNVAGNAGGNGGDGGAWLVVCARGNLKVGIVTLNGTNGTVSPGSGGGGGGGGGGDAGFFYGGTLTLGVFTSNGGTGATTSGNAFSGDGGDGKDCYQHISV